VKEYSPRRRHEEHEAEEEFNRKGRKARKKDVGATGWSPCFPFLIPLLRDLSASALKIVAGPSFGGSAMQPPSPYVGRRLE
jgi:hypothetical protein